MLDKVSRAILELHRASRDRAPADFQKAALEVVKSVVAFDSGMWVTGMLTPGGDDAVIHTLYLHNQPVQMIADWRLAEDRTVFTRKVIASAGVTLNGAVAREFGPALAGHARRYGVEHLLATATVEPVTSLNEIISLWRADAGRPFTEEERQIQQALAPHLAETWRFNRMTHLTRASQGACPAVSCAAADSKGFLRLVEPSFTRLLVEEWPGWRGPRIPDELVSAIASGRPEYIGDKVFIAISGLHDEFLLRCRNKLPLDALGNRKRAVAKYFSQGYSHKEIAQLLSLSPATVRNYLSAIYSTLNISNKAELANILSER